MHTRPEWPASVGLQSLTPTPHASSAHNGKEIYMSETVQVPSTLSSTVEHVETVFCERLPRGKGLRQGIHFIPVTELVEFLRKLRHARSSQGLQSIVLEFGKFNAPPGDLSMNIPWIGAFRIGDPKSEKSSGRRHSLLICVVFVVFCARLSG